MKVLFLPDYTRANAYQRELRSALEARGVTVRAEPTGRRKLLPILQAVRRQGRPDVVHVHWTEPYIAGGQAEISRIKAARTLAELRLLRRAGSAVVWTAHDLTRHDRPVDEREVLFGRSLVSLSAAVIVHCAAARDSLLETFRLPAATARRMHVIPHGHYAGAYQAGMSQDEARRRLGLPHSGRVLAFVGWVRPYKGVVELIDAFRRLGDPNARLLIAGQPGTRDFGESIGAMAADDDRIVTHLGFVPDDELQIYLTAADAVCLPYREIFTSGSVLLAMTFGRAVIAPRRGCIGEALDDQGALLYDAADRDGLVVALRTALGADLDGMGKHNRARLPEFDWGRIAEQTVRVYSEATEQRRSRG